MHVNLQEVIIGKYMLPLCVPVDLSFLEDLIVFLICPGSKHGGIHQKVGPRRPTKAARRQDIHHSGMIKVSDDHSRTTLSSAEKTKSSNKRFLQPKKHPGSQSVHRTLFTDRESVNRPPTHRFTIGVYMTLQISLKESSTSTMFLQNVHRFSYDTGLQSAYM